MAIVAITAWILKQLAQLPANEPSAQNPANFHQIKRIGDPEQSMRGGEWEEGSAKAIASCSTLCGHCDGKTAQSRERRSIRKVPKDKCFRSWSWVIARALFPIGASFANSAVKHNREIPTTSRIYSPSHRRFTDARRDLPRQSFLHYNLSCGAVSWQRLLPFPLSNGAQGRAQNILRESTRNVAAG
jgi:hypothetical protein